MTTDRELDEVLGEIGREHRAMDAPATLERVLCAAADSRKESISRAGLRFKWALAAALILVGVVATSGVIWQARKGHQPQTQQARVAPALAARPKSGPASAQDTGGKKFSSKSSPLRKAGSVRGNRRDSLPKEPDWNSLDEFVALPVSEGLPVATELSVVRVRVRGSELQQYGLEAPADAGTQTLLAEFAVGEDGLPRAIRIVR